MLRLIVILLVAAVLFVSGKERDSDSRIEELDDEKFDRFLRDNRNALILFHKVRSGHNEEYDTMLPDLAKRMEESHPDLKFGRLDNEKYPKIAERLRIHIFPKLVLFTERWGKGHPKIYNGQTRLDSMEKWLREILRD